MDTMDKLLLEIPTDLETDRLHLRCYQVAERCGFVHEGHLRENKKHADGTLSGTLSYGLLRSEFEAARLDAV
jgi:RimJ/RimL family protein N-acetyltransferase